MKHKRMLSIILAFISLVVVSGLQVGEYQLVLDHGTLKAANQLQMQLTPAQLGTVSVFVSGAGAYARLEQVVPAELVVLEHSSEFRDFAEQNNVPGGVTGLWNYVHSLRSGSPQLDDLRAAMRDVIAQPPSQGTINANMLVTSPSIGQGVTVRPFLQILKVSDGSNQYLVCSTAAPTQDVFGGTVNNGNVVNVPMKDNVSTMNFP